MLLTKVFTKYMICKYFLLLCGFLFFFIFLNYVFEEQRFFYSLMFNSSIFFLFKIVLCLSQLRNFCLI